MSVRSKLAASVRVPCVAATGNPVVDQVADFPGPQAMSIAGTVQMSR